MPQACNLITKETLAQLFSYEHLWWLLLHFTEIVNDHKLRRAAACLSDRINPTFLRTYTYKFQNIFMRLSLSEKCPNTEFFLIRIFPHSARIRENTD